MVFKEPQLWLRYVSFILVIEAVIGPHTGQLPQNLEV